MPFDWAKYLELARALHGHPEQTPDVEAALRTAASRAYYAAFCHTRNYAAAHLGFDPRDAPKDHGRLRAFLKKGKTQNIATRLDRLRQWRNACDYEDDVAGDLNTMAASALDEADRVLAGLSPPAPPSSGT